MRDELDEFCRAILARSTVVSPAMVLMVSIWSVLEVTIPVKACPSLVTTTDILYSLATTALGSIKFSSR